MKRNILFAVVASLLAVLLFSSCEQKVEVQRGGLGTIEFGVQSSRGISGEVICEDPYSLTWTVTATKTDGGEYVGQGKTENALLTDTFGAYSTGEWNFRLEGYKDSVKYYEGEVNTTISAGKNSIAVHLNNFGDTGTLVLRDCSFMNTELNMSVSQINVMVDEDNKKQYYLSQCTTEDNDTYFIPETKVALTKGEHVMYIVYTPSTGQQSRSATVRFRVIPNATTYITIGADKGNATFSITYDTYEALVSD